MTRRHHHLALTFGLCFGMATTPIGCSDDGSAEQSARTTAPPGVDQEDLGGVNDCVDGAVDPQPFHYASKVKYLLNGLPLTTTELDALTADPTSLSTHIEQWLDTPEADRKLVRFFERAFQQNRIDVDVLDDNFGSTSFGNWGLVGDIKFHELVMENMRESFARTALAIMQEGRAFTEVLTTQRFMMTTGLQATLAYFADRPNQDNDKDTYRVLDTYLSEGTLVWERDQVIPAEQTLDPNHPNFMHFSDPVFSQCLQNATFTFTGDVPRAAWQSITGTYWLVGNNQGITGNNCKTLFKNNQSLLSLSDFQDWKWVTVRPPTGGEEPTMFWEIEHFRSGGDFVTDAPYIGFFTTPAFWATWQTNRDNDTRVSMNQTLIVALGASFDGEDTIVPASTEGLLDADHANPESECWACHKTLDPMRQLLRQSLTYGGHRQLDGQVAAVSGVFAFDGVDRAGDGVEDLGLFMSEHPAFAPAWVQQLCAYANARPCPTDSPLFEEIVERFVASDHDFRTLVVDLFSSPLVTSATCVDGGSGNVPSIARQQHFCHALKLRLGLDDLCNMEFLGEDSPVELQRATDEIIGMIPADDYARGATSPLTISESSLFISSAYEAVCREAAIAMVGTAMWPPTEPETAIDALLGTLMGIPAGDPRHAPLRAVLADHHAEASAATSATEALQSTFMLACMSPSVTALGF